MIGMYLVAVQSIDKVDYHCILFCFNLYVSQISHKAIVMVKLLSRRVGIPFFKVDELQEYVWEF